MALKSWKEILIGGMITDVGNSIDYKTGDWRSYRPIWDEKKCNNCKLCWIYCPDGSIVVKNGVMTGMDLDHCKGCGICAYECPQKAIKMMEETKLREGVK
jgi:pyruvate ferredoxin oxidoreductase delta subunit